MLSPETSELSQGPQGRKKQREGHNRTFLINIYHTSQPCSKVFDLPTVKPGSAYVANSGSPKAFAFAQDA